MRIRVLTVTLGLAMCFAWGVARAQQAVVIWVADGDTVKVSIEGKYEFVRLLGLDAAEIKKSKALQRRAKEHKRSAEQETAAGEAAQVFARSLLHKDSVVCLEYDGGKAAWDRYGRRLAYIRLNDGTDFGAKMLSSGMVRALRRYGYARKVLYVGLEDAARRGSKGLWAIGGP